MVGGGGGGQGGGGVLYSPKDASNALYLYVYIHIQIYIYNQKMRWDEMRLDWIELNRIRGGMLQTIQLYGVMWKIWRKRTDDCKVVYSKIDLLFVVLLTISRILEVTFHCHIITRYHLAASALTVRPLVWPWQQVCVGSVQKGGVRATWILIMTSPVNCLQCARSHSGQLVWIVGVGQVGGGGSYTHSTYAWYQGVCRYQTTW